MEKVISDKVSNKNLIIKIFEYVIPVIHFILTFFLERKIFIFSGNFDFVNEIEELETLLDSKNQTLVLKVLTLLKDKGALKDSHKESALESVTSLDLRSVIEVL